MKIIDKENDKTYEVPPEFYPLADLLCVGKYYKKMFAIEYVNSGYQSGWFLSEINDGETVESFPIPESRFTVIPDNCIAREEVLKIVKSIQTEYAYEDTDTKMQATFSAGVLKCAKSIASSLGISDTELTKI